MRTALHVVDRIAVDRDRLLVFELLDILFRQLRPVHLDGQLVQLGGQRKGGL